MNRRPLFWIHRSPRFWLGLFVLAFLLGAWISSVFFTCKLSYFSSMKPSATHMAELGIGGGGFQVNWTRRITMDRFRIHFSRLPFPPMKRWGVLSRKGEQVSLSPRFRKTSIHVDYSETTYRLFIPLWLPALAWSIFWPFWMHRADKREEKLLGVDRDRSSSTSSSTR